MKTVPGINMSGRGGKRPLTRVLCSNCGKHATSLPSGVRLVRGADTSTGKLTGSCGHCGSHYTLRTTEDING